MAKIFKEILYILGVGIVRIFGLKKKKTSICLKA